MDRFDRCQRFSRQFGPITCIVEFSRSCFSIPCADGNSWLHGFHAPVGLAVRPNSRLSRIQKRHELAGFSVADGIRIDTRSCYDDLVHLP